MNDWLIYEKNGSVVTLTMNRPDIRNPLGEPEDVINFEEASKLINNDRDVRCVISVSYTHLTLPTICSV